MKIGHGLDPRTTHGPLINEKATDKVWAHVEDAINKGARLEAGGKKADYLGPCFFEPTLLTYVDKQALVNSQETFGPLAAVTRSVEDSRNYYLKFSIKCSCWNFEVAQNFQ